MAGADDPSDASEAQEKGIADDAEEVGAGGGGLTTTQKATQIIVDLDTDRDFDLTEEETLVLFKKILKDDTLDEDDTRVCGFVDANPNERTALLMQMMTPEQIDEYYCTVIEGADWHKELHEEAQGEAAKAVADAHEAAIEKPDPENGLFLKDKVTQIVVTMDKAASSLFTFEKTRQP